VAAQVIPLFPLSSVLFPGLALPLHIFEERYRLLVADLAEGESEIERSFGVVAIRAGHEVGSASVTSLHEIGTTAVLRRVTPYPDGRSDIMTSGSRRFRVLTVDDTRPYLRAEVEWVEEQLGPSEEAASLAATVGQAFQQYQALLGGGSTDEDADSELPDDPTVLSYLVSAATVLDTADRQRLLAVPTTVGRLRRLVAVLGREEAMIRLLGAVPAADMLRGAITLN
jgi:hypothetical protein